MLKRNYYIEIFVARKSFSGVYRARRTWNLNFNLSKFSFKLLSYQLYTYKTKTISNWSQ